MFYDLFSQLCDQKGVSCKKAVTEAGLSHSLAAKWKKTGATPSGATLQKLADYFGVSTDYLLGGEEIKKEASEEAPVDGELAQAIAGMSEAEQQQVLQYIRFLKSQR